MGSLLRTAEGLGVEKIFLTGYTPYPETTKDDRLPHITSKLNKQIAKTALGAEKMINWYHSDAIDPIIDKLRGDGYRIVALEQTNDSTPLPDFQYENNVALIVGREAEGIESEVLHLCDEAIEIPMKGRKESFNVVQAAAMALYHLTYLR